MRLDSVVWRGYNGLIDVGYGKRPRVDHSQDESVTGRTHINGIKSIWDFAKSRMTLVRGMSQCPFYLHTKGTCIQKGANSASITDAGIRVRSCSAVGNQSVF